MRKDHLEHMIIALALSLVLLLGSLTVDAAQNQMPAAPAQSLTSTKEDQSAWKRDPFIGTLKKGGISKTPQGIPLRAGAGPQKQDKPSEQEIQLQGIMQVDKAFHALINGRCVKVGDTLGGVTIKEITRFKVVVRNEHKENIIYDVYQGRIDRGKP